MRNPSRDGMTIIELMAVLAVVSVLMALLLPAVASVRETSRKADCTFRLADLGRAIHTFESQRGRIPRSSWRIDLLPFIEQQSLWNAAVAAKNWNDVQVVLQKGRVELYNCPSSGTPGAGRETWTADFVGCYASSPFGTGPGYSGNGRGYVNGAREDGMFPLFGDNPAAAGQVSRGRRLSEIVDGLSQTAMLSEVRHSNGSSSRLRNVWFLPPVAPSPPLDAMISLCERLPSEPSRVGFRPDPSLGNPWYLGDGGFGLYNHVLPPNRPSCHPTQSVRLSIYTASSLHYGGVNLLYGDGHAQFASDSIDGSIWAELGRINDLVTGR